MATPRRLLPSISLLMAFESVIRTGSTLAAAQDLSLTQGAVSRLIQNLEAQLGVQLFRREGRRLVPTENALAYARDVAKAMAQIEGEAEADEARAWSAPFAQSGHRAALKAWPRVQAELPAVPEPLLLQWAQARKLWLQPPASEQLLSVAQWQAAWQQAAPQLSQMPQLSEVWRQTQHGSPVPAAQQGSAAAAVEYFAP